MNNKKRLFYLMLLSIPTCMYSKALLVQPPVRSNQQAVDPEFLEQFLLSPACKTILVELTQLSQAISLVRLAPLLQQKQKELLIYAPSYMHLLLSWSPHLKIYTGDQECDAKVSFEHLLSYLAPHISKSEQPHSYLKVDEAVAALWHEASIADTNFKVGVCCSKNFTTLVHPRKKHINIKSCYPLACFEGVSLYSLDPIARTKMIPEGVPVYYFNQNFSLAPHDLAAVIKNLDIVITTEPAIAALTTMLRKQAWLILEDNNIDASFTLLYPSIRTFQANQIQPDAVIFDMMHELINSMKKPSAQIVTAEVAIGELVDKMTILQIKTERIEDPEKLENVWRELHSLQATFEQFINTTPELEQLIHELKIANEALWETEDFIRDKEREKCFDQEFVRLARKVYIQNDERCRVKRTINELLGSRLVEEKSYKPYA